MFRLFKTRLLRHYWIAYFGLAVIPMLILGASMFSIQNNNHTETAKNLYLRSMTQTGTHLDAIVSDMQATVSGMSGSEYLGGMFSDLPATKQMENAMTAYLFSAEQNSRIPAQALYYAVGSTSIHTSEGLKRYSDFEAALSRTVNLNQSQFFTLLNSVVSMRFCLLTLCSDAAPDAMPLVAFAFPVTSDTLQKQGTFIFLVSMEDIQQIIQSYLGVRPEYLYIYTSNYNSLAARYEKYPQTDAARSKAVQSGVGIVGSMTLSGERYDILHYKTDLYGFQIISCVHLDALLGDAVNMGLPTMFIVGALVLMIVVGAFFLARTFYKPVRGILANIGDDPEGEELDEFARIDRHLSTVHTEMMALQERLAMQRPMVRDRLLLALLRGTLDHNELEQLQGVCPDIRLDCQDAYVALISADRRTSVDQFFFMEKLDLDGADAHGVMLEDERLLALIVFSVGGGERRAEQCRQIREMLMRQGIHSPRVSAGRKGDAARYIPSSFLEAYIAMNSRMNADECEDVFLYTQNDAMPVGGGFLLSCDDSINIYLQSLRSVDQSTALSMLHTVLDQINEPCVSLLNVSYKRYELLSRALRLCEDDVAREFTNRHGALEQLTDTQRFTDMMEELTRANCTAVEQKRTASYFTTRQKILSTIRARCFDPDFSLGELSEQVSYSATYINRCLREETGYSFIQYVSMLRIARAKEALTTTDDKLKDITAQVGYRDVASFTRKFKENESVTPMEYRAIHRKASAG